MRRKYFAGLVMAGSLLLIPALLVEMGLLEPGPLFRVQLSVRPAAVAFLVGLAVATVSAVILLGPSVLKRGHRSAPQADASADTSVAAAEFEAFIGREYRLLTQAQYDEIAQGKGEFRIFMDDFVKEWWFNDGKSVQKVPISHTSLEWHFLYFALQRVGKSWRSSELRSEIERRYGNPFHGDLSQIRTRLNEATNGAVGSIVTGRLGRNGGYDVNYSNTCLICKYNGEVTT
ncbi:MAG: hypothetical protein JW395_1231 [Nitrospira sp.]|nr:hypothetical protein [Nitrospira sp.]